MQPPAWVCCWTGTATCMPMFTTSAGQHTSAQANHRCQKLPVPAHCGYFGPHLHNEQAGLLQCTSVWYVCLTGLSPFSSMPRTRQHAWWWGHANLITSYLYFKTFTGLSRISERISPTRSSSWFIICPQWVRSHIPGWAGPTIQTRVRALLHHENKPYIPQISITSFGARHFTVAGSTLWNSLRSPGSEWCQGTWFWSSLVMLTPCLSSNTC